MSRKDDLEQLLRDSYEIIAENQQIVQVSSDLPAQRKRAQRETKSQWELIEGYLSEYVPLCLATQTEIPTDIVQIIARFPSFVSQITKITNGERVLETAANELLVQIKLAEDSLSTFDEIPDKKNYGREITELRELVEKYHSDIRKLQFLRRDREPQIIDIPKYLEGVAKEFEEWERKYTSLRLTHELKLTAWYGEVSQLKRENRPKELSVREAVREYDRLIILGEPGSGKTTSLKRMALEYAQETRRALNTSNATDYYIPLFVQLGNYVDKMSQGLAQYLHENILWLVGDSFQSNLRNTQTETTLDDVKLTLNSYQFIFFFDGLNEVSEDIRPKCTEAIRKFARLYENHKYVVTSRKHGYVNRLDYETLEILDLSLEDISQYVARYLDMERAKKLVDQLSPQLRRIAQNPLVLRIMIDVFEEKGQLPHSRGKLLARYAVLMLERDVAERGISLHYPTADDIQLKLSICVPLGYWMQTGGQYIPESMALQIIENKLDELNRHDVLATKLVDDLCNSRLLERIGLGFVRFWHQTIQEYFAAVQISDEWQAFTNDSPSSDKKRAKKSIKDYIKNPIWHETFAISAGLLDTRQLHLLIRYLRYRNISLMAVCMGNSENLSDGDEKPIISSLQKSVAIWKYLSPEPARVLYTSWPFFLLSLGYWLIKGNPPFLYLWSNEIWGFEVSFSAFGIKVFDFLIPNTTIIYSALTWYWNWHPFILSVANILFPTAIMSALLYYIWRGLNKLNEIVFARRVYNYLTALRHIGTIRAREALAQLNIQTQSNIWVHPQYKVAILAAQLVSADAEAELLALLLNEDSKMYAIEVLGEIATDTGVDKLHGVVDSPDESVARGAISALTKVAQKRDYQKEKVVEHLLIITSDKTKSFPVRLDAYQGLKELKTENIERPLPNLTDAIRLWSKIYRPVIAVFTAILVFLSLNLTIWSSSIDNRFFYDDLNDIESSRWGPASDDELGSIAFTGGGLDITSKNNDLLDFWGLRYLDDTYGDTYQDLAFEVDASTTDGNGHYGVFFRSSDWDNFYAFVIDSHGDYRLYKTVKSETDLFANSVLLQEGYSPAILSTEINHIYISVIGDVVQVYVNDTELGRTKITESHLFEGNVGLIAMRSREAASDFTAHFDNTRISDPTINAILPYWLEPFRKLVGFGLVGIILTLAMGMMYGYPTLIRIVQFPFSNPILLLATIISLPVYVFVSLPMANEYISTELTTTFVPIWWASLLIGYALLVRERNFGLNILLILAATIVAIPFVPVLLIYFAIKTVTSRFAKPKQEVTDTRNIRYAQSLRIQLFDQLGLYDRSISELNHLVTELRPLQPDPFTQDRYAQLVYALAWRHEAAGNVQDAMAECSHGIKLGLKPLEHFYNLLGNILSNMGKHQEALDMYTQAINIAPKEAMFYRNRIIELVALGNLGDAKSDYSIAHQLEPYHSSTPYRLANILIAEGKFANALEHYQQGVALDAKRADIRFDYGLCLLRIGRPEEAQKEYKKAMSLLSHIEAKRTLTESINELKKALFNLPHRQEAEKILLALENKIKVYQKRG